ncbi:N-acetylmuramoyl-L-alanine amidase isoform X1 [Pelobates fuscus]|uniref:N-acetylmuramoyl-L-alanine amidase isoform X1 n=2 Tax=Pelobates fuscus TaxID=191477 RepID=UPI002FE47E56
MLCLNYRTTKDNLKMDAWCLTFFVVFSVCVSADNTNTTVVMNMETFITLVQDIESSLPDSSARVVAKQLLHAAKSPDYTGHLSKTQVNRGQILLSHEIMRSNETGCQEKGVVLAPDGSTVAPSALLRAVIWGWKQDSDCKQVQSENKELVLERNNSEHELKNYIGHMNAEYSCDHWSSSNDQQGFSIDSLDDVLPITLATSLGFAFLAHGMTLDTPLTTTDGCWDSISAPRFFQLQNAPSHGDLTLAFINGAMDGTILGKRLRDEPKDLRLSTLLQDYYGGKPSRSPFRRQEFNKILEGEDLEVAILRGFHCYRNSKLGCGLHNITEDHLNSVIAVAVREFKHNFLECPSIIPRCMWRAKPYNGNPTLLKTPLSQIYIHHTYTPSQPCTSFQDCSKDMQSMQNFHQQDRGWDDIGYSFVAGSDGYLYEGRGWHWVGAHTKGHNTVGYGVSFIGNFMSLLPEEPILSVVRDRFLLCGVKSGYISPNYILKGHRQLVNTSCPGDSLYQEIQKWENFKES